MYVSIYLSIYVWTVKAFELLLRSSRFLAWTIFGTRTEVWWGPGIDQSIINHSNQSFNQSFPHIFWTTAPILIIFGMDHLWDLSSSLMWFRNRSFNHQSLKSIIQSFMSPQTACILCSHAQVGQLLAATAESRPKVSYYILDTVEMDWGCVCV